MNTPAHTHHDVPAMNFADRDMVTALQGKLGVSESGTFDEATKIALGERLRHRLGDPNALDHDTVASIQKTIMTRPDGDSGRLTQTAYRRYLGAGAQALKLQPEGPSANDVPTAPNGALATSLNNKDALETLARQTGGVGGALIAEEAKYLGLDAHSPDGRRELERRGISVADGAWCARFKNHCLENIGARGTGSATALSFDSDRLGRQVGPSEGKAGDLIVLNRGNPRDHKAHIGTLLGYDEKGNPIVLAGNQGPNHDDERVTVQTFDKSAIRSIREMPQTVLAQNHRPSRVSPSV